MFKRNRNFSIKIIADATTDILDEVNKIFASENVALAELTVEQKDQLSIFYIRFNNISSQEGILSIIEKIKEISGVTNIAWDRRA